MDDRKLRQKGTVDCNKGRVGFDDGEVEAQPQVGNQVKAEGSNDWF